MGNRIGSPPHDGGDNSEESPENKPEPEEDDDGRVQDRLPGAGTVSAAGAAAAAGADAGAAAGSGVPSLTTADEPGAEPEEDDEEDDPVGDGEVPETDPSEPPEPSSDDPPEDTAPETESEEADAPEEDDEIEIEEEEERFVYGDIVIDRDLVRQEHVEKEDVERLVVVAVPGVNADAWEVGDEETVADQNPHYPPRDHVILVVLRDILDDRAPSWDERAEEIPVGQLNETNIPYRTFPSLRLELDEPSHLRGPFNG